MSLRRLIALVSCLAVTSIAIGAGADAAPSASEPPARGGIDKFTPGATYTGDFPDPSVLRVGNTWFAYGTNTGGVNVPVLSSTDLVTWTARGLDPGATSNDALPQTATWSDYYSQTAARRLTETWAPSVARAGGQYVLAYAVEVPGRGKCISLARAATPSGPFVDTSAGPVVCPATQNVIDPQIFADGKSRYLLWKTEGNATNPPKLWSQKLTKSAGALAPKGKKKRLLAPTKPWEAGIIENPAMIKFKKTYYLFYSANRWASSAYATGYAICKGPTGPCKRKPGPLIGNLGALAGVGGATPFVVRGHLRLVVHAWTAGQGYTYAKTTSTCVASKTCPQRRLHTVSLKKSKKGRLDVTAVDVP